MDQRHTWFGMALAFSVTASMAMGAAGCGGASGTGGGGGGGGGTFTISADNASYVGKIGVAMPQPGRRFLRVSTQIVNSGETTPLRAAFAYFSVKTQSGLKVMASGASAFVNPACTADISVTRGGTYACKVAFELPLAEMPIELEYDDGALRTAAAPIGMVGTLFTLGDGSYKNTSKDVVKDDCQFGLTTVPTNSSIVISANADGTFTFNNGSPMSEKFTLDGDNAAALPPGMGSHAGACAYDWKTSRQLTVVSDNHFTVQFSETAMAIQGTGGICSKSPPDPCTSSGLDHWALQ